MSEFISYQEVMARCQVINQTYQINQARFDNIIDALITDQERSPDRKVQAAFQLLLQAVSAEITDMEETANLQATCRMGCAFCCYFPIVINRMEAILIKQAIDQMPEDRKHFIQQHIRQYYKKHQAKVAELEALDITGDPEAKLTYKQANLPCVLLNTETNTCLAYEFRPLPCRTYVNYTDPKVCADQHMPKETISYEFLYQEYMGAFNELLQYLYETDYIDIIDYPDDLYQEDLLINWMREGEAILRK
ncbi:YkgJ family cysteine cluster protein [Gracilibacillus alcaliphilus]|uniref:YkgJ family cysteine cluster protein n=1 Tax=Gracilibacillus alcaliphilus TaxID=1401441 RepID=UPI00195D9519|nr:YkgJ family cysteine cluster protein [Gracilibacillus alcaliphilus]MBM7679316.1 Fe-S-cluster containining protein [Gracilibacillus alcaliphilus]